MRGISVIRVRLVLGAMCVVLGGAQCPGGILPAEPGAVDVQTAADAGPDRVVCDSDDDCPFGQGCVANLCRPNDQNLRDEGCRSDADCADGQACAVSTGRCVGAPSFPVVPTDTGGECADGQTRLCGTKVGACAYGTERCQDGQWTGSCEGSVGPSDERCDGVDNDCDGELDEGFVLGAACEAGMGACRQEGSVVCTPDGSATMCSAVAGMPAAMELCGNAIDDNCNGQTDEGFALYRPCAVGVGACERSGVTVCTEDRTATTCSATAGTPAPAELCGNNIDDDCNGTPDDGFEMEGAACSDGVGACLRTGTMVCAPDLLSLRCSATAATPGPRELCGNDADDNCNGQTDEGFDGVVGTACAVGTPPCQSMGVWACTADLEDLNCDVPAAGAELCNGADDDNDMCTDEGFDIGAGCSAGVGACRRTGVKQCRADGSGTECSVTGATPTSGELCGNGVDDDCNSQTDEGFTDLGTSCTAGQGVCRRTGARVCSMDRTATTCDAVAGMPDPRGELCGNNLDDNCNGQTDEGFDVGTACTVGTGACQRSGVRVCRADGLGTTCSATAGMPSAQGELCGNNIDDDCDGSVDEGFNVGGACTNGVGACQRSGSFVCSADRLSVTCNAMPASPGTELCSNNADDDCDGFTDEGFANLGNACTSGVGACLAMGTFVCASDRLSTVCNATPGTPSQERCDNADNDCNGVVDNGCDDDMDDYCDGMMAVVGTPPVCPRTTGASTLDCNDTDTAVHPGATETCGDARDMDCDGNPNNGCNCGPVPDADFDGVNSVACGGTDCDDTNGAIRPGATERCDGMDNNCNGTIDEGYDADGDNYTTCGTIRPAGGMDPSYVDCDDGNGMRHPFACELCANASGTVMCNTANDRGNMVDEDCDGYVDETCAPCDAVDRDGDGLSECEGDCGPADPAVSPQRTEACDGKDTDCNRFTQDNCDVGQRCRWPGYPTSSDPDPDACRDRLLCVESLSGNGRPTGSYTCTSFCNASPAGAGLGDGCTSTQTCSSPLTPTANLHGCAVNSEIGTRLTGETCGSNADCRSNWCLRDSRFSGNVRYCADYCGSDAYCANGTTCQINGSDTGACMRTLTIQNRDVGAACNGASDYIYCRGGTRSCITVGSGKQCTRPCCRDSDCPSNQHCGFAGNTSPGPVGGLDTVPVCSPDGTGAHSRLAGAACTDNGQCQSEFCDVTLGVCVDVCCNDTTCPTGLRCEQSVITLAGGGQTIARVCLNQSPMGALQAR